MWMELCTDSEEDWMKFLDICEDSFLDSAPFKKSHPDQVKRKKYLHLYTRYLYKARFSNGKAGLACLKTRNDVTKETEIIYGGCCTYGVNESRELNHSETLEYKRMQDAMIDIDRTSAERSYRQDQTEGFIHSIMSQIAFTLDINLMYGSLHATNIKYRGMNIGQRYGNEALDMIYKDGVKRGNIDVEKPTILYGIVDDIRAVKVEKRLGSAVIAHLHYGYSEKTKCIGNLNQTDNPDCVFVTCREMGQHQLHNIACIKYLFNTKSKL